MNVLNMLNTLNMMNTLNVLNVCVCLSRAPLEWSE